MEPQIIRPSTPQPDAPNSTAQEASVTIDHTAATPPTEPATVSPPAPTPVAPAPAPTPTPVESPPVEAVPTSTAEPEVSQTPWQFTQRDDDTQTVQTSPPPPEAPSDAHISWSASEFIAYHKSSGWYIKVLLVLGVIAGAAYLLTGGDWISTISILIIGILFVVFAGRKPRVLDYGIDSDGIHIGGKLYSFTTLRSFAVIDEGSLHSIALLPSQRFMPSVSMYFEPQDEDQIVAALGSYLPMEDRKQDMIDRFMHKIRF